MKALDLFCGGGGAALGLIDAGFEVTGIDINPRHARVYPGKFIAGDALAPPVDVREFDLVWSSPPCQRFSRGLGAATGRYKHPNHIPAVRELCEEAGVDYIIENVPGAVKNGPMRADVVLYGPMVGLNLIQRQRVFETSFLPIFKPPIQKVPKNGFKDGDCVTITKSLCAPSFYYRRKRQGKPGRLPVPDAREAMGIPRDFPMTAAQVGEAVPPPYAKALADMYKIAKGVSAA